MININHFDSRGDGLMYLDEKAKIIADYIKDSRYSQAVMINGVWGTGKTFFVDEYLLKELNDYIIIRYSLYGAQSSEQVSAGLNRSILLKLIEHNKFSGKMKRFKMPSKLLNLAPDVIDIMLKHNGLESKILTRIINQMDFDNDKIVIIFDDLERVVMDINEIMGLINSYVESKKIKVIIVSNESELGSSRISTDLPQKYLVASNQSIVLDEESKENNKNGNNDIVYSHSELIKRTKALFSNDIIYDSIKEKLIGLTVAINADFHQLFAPIVEKYAESSKEFLLSNKNSVIEILQTSECQNLRTFIFAIISFDKIFSVISNLKNQYKDSQSITVLNEQTTHMMKSIIYKSKGVLNSDTNDYSSLIYITKGITEYHSVDLFITSHELNKDEIIAEITGNIESELARQKENKEKESLSYYKLNSFGWAGFSDDEVISLSDQLYDELSENKYTVKFFKDIIVYLIQLEYHFKEKKQRIKHSDNDYINLMVRYIEEHNVVNNQLDLFRTFSDDKDFKKIFNDYAAPLIKATIEKEKASVYHKVKEIFDSDNWADEFYHFCFDNHDAFLIAKRFLSSFDISDIKQLLSHATNNEIQRFSQGICAVYDFSNLREFYSADIDNLEEIINILDKMYNNENTDCTTRVIIKSYKEKLEAKLKLLK